MDLFFRVFINVCLSLGHTFIKYFRKFYEKKKIFLTVLTIFSIFHKNILKIDS